MVGILVFMFIAFGTPKTQAAEWKHGDSWATTVFALGKYIDACEDLQKTVTAEEFIENKDCDISKFVDKITLLTNMLFVQTSRHPGKISIMAFSSAHFNDVERGARAMYVLLDTSEKLIKMQLKIEIGIIQNESKDIVKPKPSKTNGDIFTM